ncbi:Xylose isomerase domain-containing protein TIM barrel [Gemmatirosa kalamazoonensis]|uniref:Xylose isomerase domain-containing protein TIM barrel n=1 Tax=Gemmatirosa kalamazoonensis TaxID=861299 RepID=W0RGA3_9BACT|nr:sugar phosphate isomerase/epimerase [Gemmatirosa kalamazoonensis]AHG89467.1 Xylose isomerase domain-containing protein TIM barrel [Gemmatirosa kalamazoonensis]
MVSRRNFLATTGAAAAGLALGCRSAGTVTAPVRRDRIGVQLYTVRDQMEKDFTGTLQRVAQIGYKEVEFAGYFNHSPADVRALLDRLGLTAPSSHIGLDLLQKDLAGQIQSARTIGHEFITIPALMEAFMGRPIDADFWKRTAAEFNRIAKALQPEGIGFAYHNHSFEFEKLADGRTGYDVLLAETDPALVKFELDLFWATFAGQDPVAMFHRSPGRYAMWHVKDMRGVDEARRQAATATGSAMQKMQGAMPRLAAVGTGEIDFRRIFAEASTAGLRHFFVENDAAPNTASSLGDIETSFQNLKRLLS